MIEIINIKHTTINGLAGYVYCGRGSALGNPFKISNDMDRDAACDAYNEYFRKEIRNGNNNMLKQLELIERTEDAFGTVYLGCYCMPQRCHCETIKAYLEAQASVNP